MILVQTTCASHVGGTNFGALIDEHYLQVIQKKEGKDVDHLIDYHEKETAKHISS